MLELATNSRSTTDILDIPHERIEKLINETYYPEEGGFFGLFTSSKDTQRGTGRIDTMSGTNLDHFDPSSFSSTVKFTQDGSQAERNLEEFRDHVRDKSSRKEIKQNQD